MEEAHYQEIKTLLYQKLFFALSLTILGGVTGLYARFTPFSQARLLTAIGAGLYMIILSYYTLWLGYLHISTCFRGVAPSPSKKVIWIQSGLELPSAIYRLTLLNPSTGKATNVSMAWCIGQLIQEDGVISGESFCLALRSFISSDPFKSHLKNE